MSNLQAQHRRNVVSTLAEDGPMHRRNSDHAEYWGIHSNWMENRASFTFNGDGQVSGERSGAAVCGCGAGGLGGRAGLAEANLQASKANPTVLILREKDLRRVQYKTVLQALFEQTSHQLALLRSRERCECQICKQSMGET